MSTMARKRPLTAKIEGGQDKRVKSQNQQSTGEFYIFLFCYQFQYLLSRNFELFLGSCP